MTTQTTQTARRLTDAEIAARLPSLTGWTRAGDAIQKTYRFADYHHTMAFVNASAWISHRTDHHPDIELGYNQCKLVYTTHSAGGLSDNDFICAAKIDSLFTL